MQVFYFCNMETLLKCTCLRQLAWSDVLYSNYMCQKCCLRYQAQAYPAKHDPGYGLAFENRRQTYYVMAIHIYTSGQFKKWYLLSRSQAISRVWNGYNFVCQTILWDMFDNWDMVGLLHRCDFT